MLSVALDLYLSNDLIDNARKAISPQLLLLGSAQHRVLTFKLNLIGRVVIVLKHDRLRRFHYWVLGGLYHRVGTAVSAN